MLTFDCYEISDSYSFRVKILIWTTNTWAQEDIFQLQVIPVFDSLHRNMQQRIVVWIRAVLVFCAIAPEVHSFCAVHTLFFRLQATANGRSEEQRGHSNIFGSPTSAAPWLMSMEKETEIVMKCSASWSPHPQEGCWANQGCSSRTPERTCLNWSVA